MKKALYTFALLSASISIGFSQPVNIEALNAAVQIPVSPSQLHQQLEEISAETYMPCHAIGFPTQLDFHDAELLNQSYYWKFSASNMSIKAFLEIESLPEKDTLFVLNHGGKRLEYITHNSVLQSKWSTVEVNDELVLQYKSYDGATPNIQIRNYSLGRAVKTTEDFGDSDFCEININCSEGNNYQDVKNSTVRILTKIDNGYFWCTGSLVNNTSFDHTPYILTAEHCAMNASLFSDSADLAEWEFYFQYEAPGCANPASEGNLGNKKITGAILRARSDDNGGDFGSDFLLLELDLSFNNGDFPPSIDPYFAGWNRIDAAPSGGVGIHHPWGDIKKISTSTTNAVSGEYGTTIFDTHWLVTWSATTNGHGVTEAGSSGSAFLNSNKQITGTLTGGYASCTINTGEDYYGKFSYHWDQNGSTPDRRLKDWLDPTNTGLQQLSGTTLSDSAPAYTQAKLSIAPNPVRLGKLYINGLYRLESNMKIQIFDLRGNLVYPTNSDSPTTDISEKGYIPVGHLPNASYVLKLIIGYDVQTIKFVKLD